MKARRSLPVFRLRSTRGIARMRDLWRFAFWLSQHLPHDVLVDGVQHVRASGPVVVLGVPRLYAEQQEGSMRHITPPRPAPYKFTRRFGFATRQDAADYFAWVMSNLTQPEFVSSDFRTVKTGGTVEVKFDQPP